MRELTFAVALVVAAVAAAATAGLVVGVFCRVVLFLT